MFIGVKYVDVNCSSFFSMMLLLAAVRVAQTYVHVPGTSTVKASGSSKRSAGNGVLLALLCSCHSLIIRLSSSLVCIAAFVVPKLDPTVSVHSTATNQTSPGTENRFVHVMSWSSVCAHDCFPLQRSQFPSWNRRPLRRPLRPIRRVRALKTAFFM